MYTHLLSSSCDLNIISWFASRSLYISNEWTKYQLTIVTTHIALLLVLNTSEFINDGYQAISNPRRILLLYARSVFWATKRNCQCVPLFYIIFDKLSYRYCVSDRLNRKKPSSHCVLYWWWYGCSVLCWS